MEKHENPPVTEIINIRKTDKPARKMYAANTLTYISCVQIFISITSLSLEIFTKITLDHSSTLENIMFCSVILFVTGIVSVIGSYYKTQCLVIATMTMSIISSVSAGALCILSLEELLRGRPNVIIYYYFYVIMGLAVGLLSIMISVLSCQVASCCRQDKEEKRMDCTGEHVTINTNTRSDSVNTEVSLI